jgi:hypothetical protein
MVDFILLMEQTRRPDPKRTRGLLIVLKMLQEPCKGMFRIIEVDFIGSIFYKSQW